MHRDCSVLLAPYRAWVADAMGAPDPDDTLCLMALHIAPRNAWRVGRFLMRADIALPHWGFGEAVDKTISYLRELAASPEWRVMVTLGWRHFKQILASTGGDLDRCADEVTRRLDALAERGHAGELAEAACTHLQAIWKPVVKPLIGRVLAAASLEDGAGLASAPS